MSRRSRRTRSDSTLNAVDSFCDSARHEVRKGSRYGSIAAITSLVSVKHPGNPRPTQPSTSLSLSSGISKASRSTATKANGLTSPTRHDSTCSSRASVDKPAAASRLIRSAASSGLDLTRQTPPCVGAPGPERTSPGSAAGGRSQKRPSPKPVMWRPSACSSVWEDGPTSSDRHHGLSRYAALGWCRSRTLLPVLRRRSSAGEAQPPQVESLEVAFRNQ